LIDPGLDFFGHAVDAKMTLDDLRQFSTVVDKFLGAMEIRTQVDAVRDRNGGDHLYNESFPTILFSSTIISALIFTERESRSFCETLRKATNSRLSYRDLSGSWLDRFFNYCDKVAGLDLGVTNDLKRDIRGALEVRNCLVHASGYLPEFQRPDAVNALLTRHSIPKRIDSELEPSAELAKVVLDVVEAFINRIYESALSKYQYGTAE